MTTFREKIGIHAIKRFYPPHRILQRQEPYCSVLRAAGYTRWEELPTGAILGTVELVDVIPTVQIWCEHALSQNRNTAQGLAINHREWVFGDYGPGRFAWRLANPQPYPEPIPHTGFRGLCEWRDVPFQSNGVADTIGSGGDGRR